MVSNQELNSWLAVNVMKDKLRYSKATKSWWDNFEMWEPTKNLNHAKRAAETFCKEEVFVLILEYDRDKWRAWLGTPMSPGYFKRNKNLALAICKVIKQMHKAWEGAGKCISLIKDD